GARRALRLEEVGQDGRNLVRERCQDGEAALRRVATVLGGRRADGRDRSGGGAADALEAIPGRQLADGQRVDDTARDAALHDDIEGEVGCRVRLPFHERSARRNAPRRWSPGEKTPRRSYSRCRAW